jgi:Fic family protein
MYLSFQDGNGRVGRLLSSIPLLRCGLPPINIMGSTTLDAAKQEYVDALVKVNQDLLQWGCLTLP